MSRLELGAGTLANIATRVQSISDDLESLAGSAPAAPDAGDMSGVIRSLLSDLLAVSGEISQARPQRPMPYVWAVRHTRRPTPRAHRRSPGSTAREPNHEHLHADRWIPRRHHHGRRLETRAGCSRRSPTPWVRCAVPSPRLRPVGKGTAGSAFVTGMSSCRSGVQKIGDDGERVGAKIERYAPDRAGRHAADLHGRLDSRSDADGTHDPGSRRGPRQAVEVRGAVTGTGSRVRPDDRRVRGPPEKDCGL